MREKLKKKYRQIRNCFIYKNVKIGIKKNFKLNLIIKIKLILIFINKLFYNIFYI